MELRVITAGESHGPGLVTVVEGLPAGVAVDRDRVDDDLRRRQGGYGRGARQKIETDRAEALGGLRFGRTMGGPVALTLVNRDHRKWADRMSPWPLGADVDVEARERAERPATLPRPGHADLAGMAKFGTADLRDVLERASARETASRVLGGALCKAFLAALGVEVASHVVRIGDVSVPDGLDPQSAAQVRAAEGSPVRCLDAAAGERMVAAIDAARADRDTLGGVVEVRAFGFVPGVGTGVVTAERLDARLAYAAMSVPAIKGVEIGGGFGLAALRGSQVHDEIFHDAERGLWRETNRAGGLEGGMSNGEPIVVRAAMKPIATLMRPLRSVDTRTLEPADALLERSDTCAVPAAGVVVEAVVATELARALRFKFGGDHVDDAIAALARYRDRLPGAPRRS